MLSSLCVLLAALVMWSDLKLCRRTSNGHADRLLGSPFMCDAHCRWHKALQQLRLRRKQQQTASSGAVLEVIETCEDGNSSTRSRE